MNLQRVAAVLDNVRIHKARHDTLSEQHFRNALGKFRRGIRCN